jgi:hypothetical protein
VEKVPAAATKTRRAKATATRKAKALAVKAPAVVTPKVRKTRKDPAVKALAAVLSKDSSARGQKARALRGLFLCRNLNAF